MICTLTKITHDVNYIFLGYILPSSSLHPFTMTIFNTVTIELNLTRLWLLYYEGGLLVQTVAVLLIVSSCYGRATGLSICLTLGNEPTGIGVSIRIRSHWI